MRFLPLLQMLLLLHLSLLQLVGLLLMPLLHLLGSLGRSALHLLMFLLLPCLQLLPLFLLLVVELLLLLLVFLIQLRIARIGRRGPLHGGKLIGMDRRFPRIIFRPRLGATIRLRCGIPAICRRVILASGCLRRYNSIAAKFRRFRSGRDRRASVILTRPQLRIGTSRVDQLLLRSYGADMPLAPSSLLRGRRASIDPTGASVKTDVVAPSVVDSLVINVVDVGDVHVHHGAVVIEAIVLPASSHKAVAEIAEAIVDSSVETDRRPPKSFME